MQEITLLLRDQGGAVPLEGNGARPSHRGDGYGEEGDPMFTLNTTEVHAVAYGISAYESNAMLSSNPHSGIYEATTSRTLDLNCGNPACNQGGVAIVQRVSPLGEQPEPCHDNRRLGEPGSHRSDG